MARHHATRLCRWNEQAWIWGIWLSLVTCHLITNGVSQVLDRKAFPALLGKTSRSVERHQQYAQPSASGGPTPAELGRQHGIPPELHALIYSGGEDAPLSPLGCRTLSYVYGCRGHGPYCNGEWCNKSPEDQQKCNSLVQAGLRDRANFMETESATRALTDTAKGFKNLAENERVLTVMSFLCEPTEVPWWPADPQAGPSPPRVSDGPVSKLAHDLRGKTMLMIGDSVIEQTCGAMVCAMRRDASLRARLSPRIAEWQSELGHATLDGPAGASWEAEATGFTLLCWRMNQYNNATFNSEERYRRLLAVSQPDVLVVNHGAHHGGDIGTYTNNMQHLFNLVKGLGYSRPQPDAKGGGNGKVFLWSTTTAQHFDTPTGDFDPRTQKQRSCYCADAKKGISTISENQARKTQLMSQDAGFGPPLEMYKLTSTRSHLHLEECRNFMLRDPKSQECGPLLDHKICDCTHLCYSPAFFDSVAQRLRAKLFGASPLSAAAASAAQGGRIKRQRKRDSNSWVVHQRSRFRAAPDDEQE